MKEYDKYLKLLKEKHHTKQSVYRELINLTEIMNLPKGTEHFMSDLHGEYDAFYHIINNCSGVIREKVAMLYGDNCVRRPHPAAQDGETQCPAGSSPRRPGVRRPPACTRR